MSRIPGTSGRARWRHEATIHDAEPGPSVVTFPDGREFQDLLISTDDETIARIKAGRICLNCLEPLEEAFPEICHALKLPDGTVVGCFYRVRDRQLIDLAEKAGSLEEVRVGPRTNMADELERLRELDAYEERTGIRLPDHVKFPNETIPHR